MVRASSIEVSIPHRRSELVAATYLILGNLLFDALAPVPFAGGRGTAGTFGLGQFFAEQLSSQLSYGHFLLRFRSRDGSHGAMHRGAWYPRSSQLIPAGMLVHVRMDLEPYLGFVISAGE